MTDSADAGNKIFEQNNQQVGQQVNVAGDYIDNSNTNGKVSFTPEQWAAAEARYRELALQSCDIIDLANLPEDRQIMSKQLELRRLYVPLRARVERLTEDTDDAIQARLEVMEESRRTAQWEQPGKGPKRDIYSGDRFPVGDRLAKARRLVVLGDPGAGKSTLLRWIATAYLLRLKADSDWQSLPDVQTLPEEAWLPIYIRCRELTAEEVRGTLDDFLCRTLRMVEMSDEQAACFRAFLPEKLRRGDALLLIDGLDEIQDPGLRAQFSRHIEQLAVAYERAPIIATSRIVGYREMRLRIGRGFEHLIITDLEKAEKDDFIRRWCELVERPERKEAAASELIHDIHSSDRIERLTGNPMLLTTMALVKRRVGRLPSRRVKLYEEAVRVLLYWRSDVDKPLDEREALPQLEYLAYAMCRRGIQQIHREDVLTLLEEMRAVYPNLRQVQNRSPEDFLRLLEARTGVLIESGYTRYDGQLVPVYEFRHLTFQEYLAGLALVQGKYPGFQKGWRLADIVALLAGEVTELKDGGDREWAVVGNWREAIRLCVAICNDEDVDEVLLSILRPGMGEDSSITAYPRAVLAALCLADEPDATESVVQEVLQTFCAQVDVVDYHGNYSHTMLGVAALEVAVSAWGEKLRLLLVEEFCRQPFVCCMNFGELCGMMVLARLDESVDQDWLEQQMPVLVSGGIPAIEILWATIRSVSYKEIYMIPDLFTVLADLFLKDIDAARAVAYLLFSFNDNAFNRSQFWRPDRKQLDRIWDCVNSWKGDPFVVFLLTLILSYARDSRSLPWLLLLLESQDPLVRGGATTALGDFGDLCAVEPLLARLEDFDPSVRENVVEALGKFSDIRVVDPLLLRLKDSEVSVRQAAVKVLGKLGDLRVLDPLLECLSDPDPAVQRDVVEALGQLGDVRATETLLGRLEIQDVKMRGSAAQALGQLGDVRALESLAVLLKDPALEVREVALKALGQIKDLRAAELVVEQLGNRDLGMGMTVEDVLSEMGVFVIEPLIGRLNDPVPGIRQVVIRLLGRFDDVRIVKAFISRLNDSNSWEQLDIRESLLLAKRESVLESLLAEMCDLDSSVRVTVARFIGELNDVRAAEHLLKQLSDPQPAMRQAVIRSLAKIGDRSVIEHIAKCLDDPVSLVRQSAAEALGKLGDMREIGSLVAHFDDPEIGVRVAIERSLIGIGKPVGKLLSQRLSDPDVAVRLSVVKIVMLCNDMQAIDLLLDQLEDSNADVRKAVIEALGALGDARVVDPLIAKLEDPVPDVRRRAANALRELGDVKAVEPLLKLVNDSESIGLTAVIEALGKLGDVRAVEPLLAKLDDEDDDNFLVPLVARKALIGIGEPGVVRLIEELNDPSGVNPSIIEILGEIGDLRAVEPVMAYLSDSRIFVREAAIEALGLLGDARAVDPLLIQWNASDSFVRKRVKIALVRIGPSAVEALLAALRSPEPAIRLFVVEVLNLIGDVRAVDSLVILLNDPDVRVRRVVVEFLRKFGDIQTVEPLIAQLNDPEADVRKAVIEALGKIGDARSVVPLMMRLDDSNGDMRQAAIESLGQFGDAQRLVKLTGYLKPSIRCALSEVWSRRCSDEKDQKLFFVDVGAWAPNTYMDFYVPIDAARLQKASSSLDLPVEEIRRRYEALAQQFPLKLAWLE